MNLKEKLAQIEPDVYGLYRTIHEHPELGMEEYRTSALVEKSIVEHALADELIHIAPTGLFAVINGKKEGNGPTLLLRADMDALPLQEDEGHDPRSKVDGVMHGCGHDSHTAVLLGTMRLLKQYEQDFSGRICFFFQPSEETVGGAKLLLESPLVDMETVDGVAACHMMPDLYSNEIGIKTGAMQASADTFVITVKGKGGHGAHPYTTVDPIVTASQIIGQLQCLVAREVNALDAGVVSVCSIHSDGDAFNVIPDRVVMKGSIRALKKETRQHLQNRVRQTAEGIAMVNRANAEVEIVEGPPPLLSDDDWVENTRNAVGKLIGPENVKTLEAGTMGAEDFAYIKEGHPGIFVRVGCRTRGRDFTPIHSGRFTVDRESLTTAMLTMCGIALDFFGVQEEKYQ